MKKQQVTEILEHAEQICTSSGNRLTEKRKQLLAQLVKSGIPLSAYELADIHNKAMKSNMPVMSVYRILEFLESENLVHKLSSNNKYISCSHIQCSHSHGVPQFLICAKCNKVEEITFSPDVIRQIESRVSEAGYKLTDSHIELRCICDSCRAA